MIYGMYLARRGEPQAALEKYDRALELQPDSAEVNYNAGLAYFDVKKYERAKELATKAYSMGYPLPGLRNKLARVGHWSASDSAKTGKK
jgi:tetratricopeptide (TPR) repeat protein